MSGRLHGALVCGLTRGLWASLACLILCLGVGELRADTVTLSSYPVEIVFRSRDERVARKVAEVCEHDIDRLASELGLSTVSPIRIDVVTDMRPYRHSFSGNVPVWGVAFALLREQVIVVDVQRATRQYNSLDRVIPHELSHLLLAQRVGTVACPVWFLEGLAQWQAREWSLVDNWQLMNTVWSKATPLLWHLMNNYPADESSARAAYRISYAAFADAFGSRSAELPAFLGSIGESGGFEPAFEEFTGVALVPWMVSFHEGLERKYHSRLLVFQTGPLFSIAAVVFLFVGLRAYIRKRRRLKDLEREERGVWLDGDSGGGV